MITVKMVPRWSHPSGPREEIIKWLTLNVGISGRFNRVGNWQYVWQTNSIRFNNTEDALAFKLKFANEVQ